MSGPKRLEEGAASLSWVDGLVGERIELERSIDRARVELAAKAAYLIGYRDARRELLEELRDVPGPRLRARLEELYLEL